jgi:hypothetical protein
MEVVVLELETLASAKLDGLDRAARHRALSEHAASVKRPVLERLAALREAGHQLKVSGQSSIFPQLTVEAEAEVIADLVALPTVKAILSAGRTAPADATDT